MPAKARGLLRAQVKPWLPIGDTGTPRDVADQMSDPDSTLLFCRGLIAVRRAEFGDRVGDYELLSSAEESWSYRVGPVTVLANFSGQRQPATPPAGQILLANYGKESPTTEFVLEPWQGVVYLTS
jgi:glycosidase